MSEDRHDARLHAPSVASRQHHRHWSGGSWPHDQQFLEAEEPPGRRGHPIVPNDSDIDLPAAIRTSAIRSTAETTAVGTNGTSPTPTPNPSGAGALLGRPIGWSRRATRWIRRVRLTLAAAITPDATGGPTDWAFGARSIRSAVPRGPLGRTVGSSRSRLEARARPVDMDHRHGRRRAGALAALGKAARHLPALQGRVRPPSDERSGTSERRRVQSGRSGRGRSSLAAPIPQDRRRAGLGG